MFNSVVLHYKKHNSPTTEKLVTLDPFPLGIFFFMNALNWKKSQGFEIITGINCPKNP